MMNHKPLEYGRIKVNTKTLDDAIKDADDIIMASNNLLEIFIRHC